MLLPLVDNQDCFWMSFILSSVVLWYRLLPPRLSHCWRVVAEWLLPWVSCMLGLSGRWSCVWCDIDWRIYDAADGRNPAVYPIIYSFFLHTRWLFSFFSINWYCHAYWIIAYLSPIYAYSSTLCLRNPISVSINFYISRLYTKAFPASDGVMFFFQQNPTAPNGSRNVKPRRLVKCFGFSDVGVCWCFSPMSFPIFGLWALRSNVVVATSIMWFMN